MAGVVSGGLICGKDLSCHGHCIISSAAMVTMSILMASDFALSTAIQGNGTTSIFMQAATWIQDNPSLVEDFRRFCIIWPYSIMQVNILSDW